MSSSNKDSCLAMTGHEAPNSSPNWRSQGCAFDKDNTLTLPYLKQVHPKIQASLDECKHVFNGNVVLFSNSAGLHQFDPEGALQACCNLGRESRTCYKN